MQWFIEDTNLPFELAESNGLQLLNVVKEMGIPYHCIGFIPFIHEVTGVDEANPEASSFFYGSCALAAEVATWSRFRPGVFWQEDWFDARCWHGKRSDLLNERVEVTTVNQLRSAWVVEPTFIKSIKIKGITGQVIEPETEDRTRWTEEHSDLPEDMVLITAPIVKIEREWRFFLVNGEVVTGSTYRKDGYRCTRHPVSSEAWTAAKTAAQGWLPSPTIVMDIARTHSGEYKVIEFNSLNSSGFYNSDIPKLVTRLEEAYP